jgi:3-isopropylmalate dehydrogenase
MFTAVARGLQAEYPEVLVDDYHVDAIAALLVRRPGSFDVIVTENMFGDILSDLAGELVGGMGTSASINASDEHAMAQAVHGGAPDIAGQDIANPIGMVMSIAMLLRWLGERRHDVTMTEMAAAVEAGVLSATERGARTRDVGGTCGTLAAASAIAEDAIAILGRR